MFKFDDREFWSGKIEEAIGVEPTLTRGSQRQLVFCFDFCDAEYHLSIDADDLVCNVDCGLPAAVGSFEEAMQWIRERSAA